MRKLFSPLMLIFPRFLLTIPPACGPKQSSTPPPREDHTAAMPAGANAPAMAARRASGAPAMQAAMAETAPRTETKTAPAPTRAETRSVMSARPICYRKCQEEFERCVTRAAKHGGKGRLGCNGAQRECIASCDRLLK